MTENILIRVHDKTLKFVGFITPQMYSNAVWKRYLMDSTSEVSTFEFELYKTDAYITSLLNDKAWISFSRNGRSFLFGTNKVAEDESKISFICEVLNLELINETTPEYKSGGAKTFLQLFNAMGLNLSQVQIGINELAAYTRSVEFEGTDTKLKRLSSLVNKFDGEMEFIDKLHPDGTLDKIVLNLYKKHSETTQGVGTRRNDLTLFYRKNIQTITRTVDKSGLYTAIIPVGKNGLTVSSLDKTEHDDNGNVLFISPQGHRAIMCPSMADEYPSQLSSTTGDKHIKLDWSYETDNVNVLYGQALAKLKQIYLPAITYEVTGFFEAEIGDTLKINDDGFDPVLLLEARVTMQEIHFKNPSNNKTVFDNFRALQNKLSQDIQSRLAEMIDQATPYKAVTSTTNGTQFKNGIGSTDLIGHIYKGTSEVTPDSYIWKKGDVTLPNTTNTLTVSASDVDEKAVYRWDGVISGVSVAFDEVTITDVSDGKPTGITQSDIVPTETYDGMMWQYTGVDDLPVTGAIAVSGATYVLNDDNWSAYELPKENINVAKLGDVADIIGKVFNEFEYATSGGLHKGSITINENVKFIDEDTTNANRPTVNIDLATSSSFSGMQARFTPVKTDPGGSQLATYTPQGIYFQDSINNWGGSITAENVTLVPWTNISYLSGYTTAENNPCQYRKIRNLDGSYTVKFRGQVKPTSGNFASGSTVYALTIPSGIMPNQNRFGAGITDATSNSTVRVGVIPSFGTMQIKTNGAATTYVSLDFMSYDL